MGRRKHVIRPGRRRVSLREVGVTSNTLTRYRIQVRNFFVFLRLRGEPLPESLTSLDELAAEFIDHLWREGEPEGWAADFFSGLKRLVPRVRRGLPITSFYLANWRRTIRRTRAVPFSSLVAQGLAGVALSRGAWGLGAGILAGFVGLLRTDEVLRLRVEHVLPFDNGRRAVLVLPSTKSGLRFNATEKVVVSDPLVVAALRKAAEGKERGARLCPFSPAQFNEELRSLAASAGMRPAGISGYSLRRGGATWHFLTFASLSKTTVHGRWAHEKTARIYIDGALAQQAEGSLTAEARQTLVLGGQVARGLLGEVAARFQQAG